MLDIYNKMNVFWLLVYLSTNYNVKILRKCPLQGILAILYPTCIDSTVSLVSYSYPVSYECFLHMTSQVKGKHSKELNELVQNTLIP